MDPNLTSAIVSASGTTLVALVALILNSKRFDDMGKRMDRIERRLEIMESDLKEFFRTYAELDKRVQRLEDKQ